MTTTQKITTLVVIALATPFVIALVKLTTYMSALAS